MQAATIESEGYRLECEPGKGGVLRSLTWFGRDVLRAAGANCDDPLQTAMFPLVPFSNRLSEDVVVNGRPVCLPRYLQDCDLAIHGFGWQKEWQVEQLTKRTIRIALEDSHSPWPSAYRAEQELSVGKDGFVVKLTLTNNGTDPLPAGIGFHPYFPREDCLMTINVGSKWERDELGLPFQPVSSGWEQHDHVSVACQRLDHSFSRWNGVAQLRWPTRNLGVELTTDQSLRELVIYSPKEDFFCLEPVSHLTNAMFANEETKRRGWRVLDPGCKMTGTMRLRARRLT